MKTIKNMFSPNYKMWLLPIFVLGVFVTACDFEYALPESGSIADATLPSAAFSASQSNVEEWREVRFTNESASSTDYFWEFHNGETSTEQEPTFLYEEGEGDYEVSLTVSDKNGVSDKITNTVTVIEPEEPDVPNPTVVNFEFEKLPKSSGSDCACSAWINTDLGEQGESSSFTVDGNEKDVVKFDNAEPDHIYQEFEITPNADFSMQLSVQFKSLETGSFPSMLEVRVLAGSGYVEGYTPGSYSETTEFPQSDYGYASLDQAIDPANNLMVEVIENPGDDGYLTYDFMFNSGDNGSVALFIRGIGNADPPEDAADFARWGFCSGEEEIRCDYVLIEAINE